MELSLKRRGICCSSFLFPVVWNEDMIARATAAVLDSEVNLKVEAMQGSRHVAQLWTTHSGLYMREECYLIYHSYFRFSVTNLTLSNSEGFYLLSRSTRLCARNTKAACHGYLPGYLLVEGEEERREAPLH